MKMEFFAMTLTGFDKVIFDSCDLGGPNASFEEMRKKAEELYTKQKGKKAMMFDTFENLMKKM